MRNSVIVRYNKTIFNCLNANRNYLYYWLVAEAVDYVIMAFQNYKRKGLFNCRKRTSFC